VERKVERKVERNRIHMQWWVERSRMRCGK